jgi:hypothetical protein
MIEPDSDRGISSFEVSLERQYAIVTGTATAEDIIERIGKTGKTVSYAGRGC